MDRGKSSYENLLACRHYPIAIARMRLRSSVCRTAHRIAAALLDRSWHLLKASQPNIRGGLSARSHGDWTGTSGACDLIMQCSEVTVNERSS